jgi:hypothetical protein
MTGGVDEVVAKYLSGDYTYPTALFKLALLDVASTRAKELLRCAANGEQAEANSQEGSTP